MHNLPAIAAGVSALMSAAVTVLFSVGWVNRRHTAKLLEAQAAHAYAQADHERADALTTVVEGATAGLIIAMQKQLADERHARVSERDSYMSWLAAITRAAELEAAGPRVTVMDQCPPGET